MRKFSSVGIFVVLGFLTASLSALTYVVDASCGTSVNSAIAEVIQMTTSTLDRLGRGDEVIKAALQLIFKTTDAGFLTDGFKLGKTNARWRLERDAEISGKQKKKKNRPLLNSERLFEKQIYWDERNEIWRNVGSKGCQDVSTDGEKGTYAQTYQKRLSENSGQNRARASITVCPLLLGETYKLLSDFPVETDLSNDNLLMEDMQDFMSVTILYELCHIEQIFGVPGSAGDEPNGWEDIMALPDFSAAKGSADAYAFLGLAAILADGNAKIALELERAQEGHIAWISPPQRLTTKRGSPVSFSS